MSFAPDANTQNIGRDIGVIPWEVSKLLQGSWRLAARLQTDPLQTHGLLKVVLISCNTLASLSAARKGFKSWCTPELCLIFYIATEGSTAPGCSTCTLFSI